MGEELFPFIHTLGGLCTDITIICAFVTAFLVTVQRAVTHCRGVKRFKPSKRVIRKANKFKPSVKVNYSLPVFKLLTGVTDDEEGWKTPLEEENKGTSTQFKPLKEVNSSANNKFKPPKGVNKTNRHKQTSTTPSTGVNPKPSEKVKGRKPRGRDVSKGQERPETGGLGWDISKITGGVRKWG